MTSDFTHDDVAVIIVGTNDLSEVTLRNRRPATRLPILESFIESQAETNVFVVSQFRRYDILFSNIINQESIRVNKRLAQHKEINLINVQNFGRRLFTDHGLHLNRMGKKLLSKNIADSIKNWFCNKSQLHNQNSNNEKWNRLSQEETLSDHNTSVKVTTLPQVIKMTGTVEESMKSIVILKTIINDVIDNVNDDRVGFAH